MLRVSGHRRGIAAAEMPRLFERFHRVQNAPARSNEGSGIGLALVRSWSGCTGARITADSTEHAAPPSPSRSRSATGTWPTDSVVPAAAAPGPATRPPMARSSRRPCAWLPGGAVPTPRTSRAGRPGRWPALGAACRGRGGGSVLIADDNADMREYLQRLLQPRYRVTAVADGQAALDAARAAPPT